MNNDTFLSYWFIAAENAKRRRGFFAKFAKEHSAGGAGWSVSVQSQLFREQGSHVSLIHSILYIRCTIGQWEETIDTTQLPDDRVFSVKLWVVSMVSSHWPIVQWMYCRSATSGIEHSLLLTRTLCHSILYCKSRIFRTHFNFVYFVCQAFVWN